MSDTTSAPAEAPSEKQSGGLLRIILFFLLFIMLGLLVLNIYTKRTATAAFDKVLEQVVDKTKATPEEIHTLLGRKPDQPIEAKEHYFEETYSWRRGNLISKEYITVLYANVDGKPELHEVVRNVPPEANDIPNPAPAELTPEELARMSEAPPEGSGEEAPVDDEPVDDETEDATVPTDEPE